MDSGDVSRARSCRGLSTWASTATRDGARAGTRTSSTAPAEGPADPAAPPRRSKTGAPAFRLGLGYVLLVDTKFTDRSSFTWPGRPCHEANVRRRLARD